MTTYISISTLIKYSLIHNNDYKIIHNDSQVVYKNDLLSDPQNQLLNLIMSKNSVPTCSDFLKRLTACKMFT